ncbi:MAG: nucleotidyltransferase family protein [Alphaproteobacteria bacterium]
MEQITQAFLLAAGRGKRMLHLTDDKPKPLVEVAGKCLIDYNVEHSLKAGVNDCVVNLCYKGDMIREHLLKTFPNVHFIFSDEEEALETGGGIKNALPKMQNEPFFVINSDALWAEDSDNTILEQMRQAWNSDKYDMMLMLQPIEKAYGVGANGDYLLENGYPVRRRDKETKAPYLYGGIMICHPRVFDNEPEGKYSLVRIFDRLENAKRLGYFIHQGSWFHVGDPEAKEVAEAHFSKSLAG